MKRLFLIASFTVWALNISAQSTGDSISAVKKEDSLIEEVIQSGTIPKKEKVQYFNQVTKYGFKNLFSNYSYNPGLPYNAQVNPNAESFIQDYIKLHGASLLKMKG